MTTPPREYLPLDRLADQLPGHLNDARPGDRWERVREDAPRDYAQFAERGRGLLLTVHCQPHAARLEVSGAYPQPADRVGVYVPDGAPRPITLGRSKQPAALAVDIARRFLPDYIEAHARAAEQVRADDQARRQLVGTVVAHAALVGDRPAEGNPLMFSRLLPSGLFVRGTYSPPGSVRLDLDHLTEDQARQVLELVARLRGPD